MDFQPTEDQKALREGIRSFIEGQVPSSFSAGDRLLREPGHCLSTAMLAWELRRRDSLLPRSLFCPFWSVRQDGAGGEDQERGRPCRAAKACRRFNGRCCTFAAAGCGAECPEQ